MESKAKEGSDGGVMPGLFVSQFTHSLDPKKRLIIPAIWRQSVGQPRQLFVLRGVNQKCLYVFPAREIHKRLEAIQARSIADEKATQFMRVLASSADLVMWDGQGRIRIKDELLSYAELSDQVLMASNFRGFELWNPKRWATADQAAASEGLVEAAKYVGF